MLNYFKQLLITLQLIEGHLAVLARCVVYDIHHDKDRNSILTKDWRDANGN